MMDRPKQTTWATGWIEYADWLEAENKRIKGGWDAMDEANKNLLIMLKDIRAERDKLRETVKNAYFDGWDDGRCTCTVTGDPTIDWNSSETESALNTSQTITDTEEQFQKSVGVRDDG
jgi:hypothetical protein